MDAVGPRTEAPCESRGRLQALRGFQRHHQNVRLRLRPVSGAKQHNLAHMSVVLSSEDTTLPGFIK